MNMWMIYRILLLFFCTFPNVPAPLLLRKLSAGVSPLKGIAGHFAFGIHEYVPQSCKYVTILRAPVERAISHFDFARQGENHYLHALASAYGASLLDYIRSPQNIDVRNGQVLLWAGIGWGVHSGKTGEEILERARGNLLDYFALVGIMEQFDDFLYLIRRFFKWDIREYEKKNVNLQPTYPKDLPAATLNAIAACNRLDQNLYEDVKKAFNNRLKLYSG